LVSEIGACGAPMAIHEAGIEPRCSQRGSRGLPHGGIADDRARAWLENDGVAVIDARLDSPIVVLGGVGMPAFAALPLLQALDEGDIIPRAVVASGFGCLVAALWASGLNAAAIEAQFGQEFGARTLRRTQIGAGLSLLGFGTGRLGHRALWREGPFRALLDRWFGSKRFEDLSFPLSLCLTDFENATLVRADQGRLADAVYAGCAHFPLLPPALINGRCVFDGSCLQPLPVLAASRYMGPILALEAFVRTQHGPRRFENLHGQIFGIFHRHIGELHLQSVRVIHPWPVYYRRICVAEIGDAWDPAIATLAIKAGRDALRIAPTELASVLGRPREL
jgi:NTE family protein